jgi:hypothetical protein
MDLDKHDHWHICDGSDSFCGEDVSDIGWHLPDEPFVNINLCLNCWEKLAETTPHYHSVTVADTV